MLPFSTTDNHCISDVTGMCQRYGIPQAAEEVASGYCFDACPGSPDSAGAEALSEDASEPTAQRISMQPVITAYIQARIGIMCQVTD